MVHRPGALGAASTGAGGEDDRLRRAEGFGQRVGVSALNVQQHRVGPDGGDVVALFGAADDRVHGVPGVGELRCGQQSDLAVAADYDNSLLISHSQHNTAQLTLFQQPHERLSPCYRVITLVDDGDDAIRR